MSEDTTESLLREAENALHGFAMAALAVSSPFLTKPYTDQPDLSPWTRSIGPQARRAHDLAQTIRKHLGIGHHMASRALGAPPLTAADALREHVAALHMAGIKTGDQYEHLTKDVLADLRHA